MFVFYGFATGLHAQGDQLQRATEFAKAKNFDAAKLVIDSAFRMPATKSDPYAWAARGFIYYYLSAKYEKFKMVSTLRDTALNSVRISNNLNPEPKTAETNKTLLKKISENYFNICKSLLQDSLNFERSQMAYKKYKELYTQVEPSFDFKLKDIEYYSAVGSIFADIYNQDNTKIQAGEIAKIALLKVLEIDPKNISANINLGIIYYNQGVNLINQMALDTPLDKLEVIQDNSAKLFKQSLPFMSKVYQLDPKNLKALESLRQIYQALNDEAKSLEFNKKLEQAKSGK